MQQYPQIFTLVLMLGVVASIVTLFVAVYHGVRGRWVRARALVIRWVMAASVYLLVSVTVSFFKPPLVIPVGADWCFDDWCLAITRVTRTDAGGASVYTTDIRISNRARRPEAAVAFWAYVRDDADHRYAPLPGSWSTVVATKVPGYGTANTSMTFRIPHGSRDLGFVTDHGGSTPCGLVGSLLEIGQGGCLFHPPNMIRIE
jgi:hypothetical protein